MSLGHINDLHCDMCHQELDIEAQYWTNWELHETQPDVWKVVCELCVGALELDYGK